MSSVLLPTFAALFGLLLIGAPIWVCLGIPAMIGMFLADIPIMIFTQRLFNTFDSFPLMAVPFFVLAGMIMQKGTIANTLLGFCRTLIGHIRGGMSQISLLTCLFYGALCGSSPATTAAVGGIMIPAMENDNYPRTYATAVNTVGGCLGVLIPPSVPLIIYGATVGCSISELFIATIIPGIVTFLCLSLTGYIICRMRGYGSQMPKASLKERLRSAYDARYALMVPIIVLGGIYGGIFTPTEAGAVAVFYAFFVEKFITKVLTLKLFMSILIGSLKVVGITFVIIACANALGTLLIYQNAHEVVNGFLTGISTNPYVVLTMIILLLLFLGTFCDGNATILVLAPLLVPVVQPLGVDIIHFGVMMELTLTVGYMTPPVGTNLFMGSSIGKVPFATLSVAVLPFLLGMIVSCFIVAFIPALSLVLIR